MKVFVAGCLAVVVPILLFIGLIYLIIAAYS